MNLITSIILTINLVVFFPTDVSKAKKSIQAVTLSKSESGSVFFVDKRIELFNVIQRLSKSYFAKTKLNFNYVTDVDNYFDKYRLHEAVTSLDKLISFGFNTDAPISFFLHISPELDSIYSGLPKETIDRAGGISNLKYFLRTVKAFAAESKFDDFFNSHKFYYSKLISEINEQYPTGEIIGQVESYYNMKLPPCKVIFSTLTMGGFGPKVTAPDGKEIYATVASPVKLDENGEVSFFSNEAGLRYLIWHELSHPIVNPLVEKYWNELSKFNKLIEVMKNPAPNWYKNDKVIYFETIVRAANIRMAYLNFGNKKGEEDALQQTKWGFPYAEVFTESLSIDENKDNSFENRFINLINDLEKINNSLETN